MEVFICCKMFPANFLHSNTYTLSPVTHQMSLPDGALRLMRSVHFLSIIVPASFNKFRFRCHSISANVIRISNAIQYSVSHGRTLW